MKLPTFNPGDLVKLKAGQLVYSGRPPGSVRLYTGKGSRQWKLWKRGGRRFDGDKLGVVIDSIDTIGQDGDPNTKSTELVLLIDDAIVTASPGQCKRAS
jgi:hypothetical protein